MPEELLIVADIGGTNIRFAQARQGRLEHLQVYLCRHFPSLRDALSCYLKTCENTRIRLCLAIAGPVAGDRITMTNLNWSFSKNALKAELALAELHVINDYEAIALSIPKLAIPKPGRESRYPIGAGEAQAGSPIAVCGPGTGLGVAHLIYNRGQWLALPGEGGHVDFAATNPQEQAIFNILQRQHGHVSAERLLSGPGLKAIYLALCEIENQPPEALDPQQISARALAASCPLCCAALNHFCEILGSFAGNLALILGSFGGVYIAGGIVPGFLDFFRTSGFRERFEAKGRYRGYNAAIPTYVITEPYPGMLGAALFLEQHSMAEPLP
ncbi:MAG: glucokinase [Pseudomonadales bacterium]|nr:glucokinase [Pseudomonadales bacterium]